MIHLSYSFCMTMLHSFWQAVLLLVLYIIIDKLIHKNNAPLAKRNILYATLFTQLILSGLTFSVYYYNSTGAGIIAAITETLVVNIGLNNLQLITPFVFSVYVFVIGFKLFNAIYSWYHFKTQLNNGLQKPGVELKLFTELKAYQFGIGRKVKLWLSHNIQTPITFGFFKPVILLPVALVNNITAQQAETLILHELTHIRTNDYLLNWFLISAEAIFFFNPFIINICKKIRLEREKNCDINVLAFEYSPVLYAETLMQAERMKQLVPQFQLAAVNQKKHLLQRIIYFTNKENFNKQVRFNIVAPIVGLLLLFVLSATILLQAGKTNLPANASLTTPYLPSHDFLITEADYGNSLLDDNIEAEHTTQKTEIKKQPIINAPVCEPAPKPETEKQREINIEKQAELNFALPIAVMENDAAKQIIIKEEGAGTASVKAYYLSFEDGNWILRPEWVITAKEINTDSLSIKIDSLTKQVRRIYPAQQ